MPKRAGRLPSSPTEREMGIIRGGAYMKKAVIFLLLIVTFTVLFCQSSYFTGNGAGDITLAVLEPAGVGLQKNEEWMLSLIQSSLTSDLKRYSAMTIVDRQNVEKIMQDQFQALSTGYYSDNDFVSIGHATNARYILTGFVRRTSNTLMLELTITDAQSHTIKASISPRSVSQATIENLSAVKEATADLLRQLGVNLTTDGLAELRKPLNINHLQAETALAQGISAQRQGTQVIALSYFYQATALDPSLFEAASRSTVLTSNINSGNIGTDVRNDIQWRKDWIARLTETENIFHRILDSADPPYTLFYSPIIEHGRLNYQNETVDIGFPISMRMTNIAWLMSVSRAANEVLAGLNATNRKHEWGLGDWPRQGLTSTNPFTRDKEYLFTIRFDLINQQNKTIGSQTSSLTPRFRFLYTTDGKISFNYDHYPALEITYIAIRVNDISDNLSIHIASINGQTPQNAKIPIVALTEQKWTDYRKSDALYQIQETAIYSFMGNKPVGQLVIPSEYWGKPITTIKSKAFYNKSLTGVILPSSITTIEDEAFAQNQLTTISIPNSVTYIGKGAFGFNRLTSITLPISLTALENEVFISNQLSMIVLPASLRSIGAKAFYGNHTMQTRNSSITIGDNVSISSKSFANNWTDEYRRSFDQDLGFVALYASSGRKAGVYAFRSDTDKWERKP